MTPNKVSPAVYIIVGLVLVAITGWGMYFYTKEKAVVVVPTTEIQLESPKPATPLTEDQKQAQKIVSDYLTALSKKDFATADSFFYPGQPTSRTATLSNPNRSISFTLSDIVDKDGTVGCQGFGAQNPSKTVELTCHVVSAKIFEFYAGQQIGFTENSYVVAVNPPTGVKTYLEIREGDFVSTNENLLADNFYKVKLSLNSGVSEVTNMVGSRTGGNLFLVQILASMLGLVKEEVPNAYAYANDIIPAIKYYGTQGDPHGFIGGSYHPSRTSEYYILVEPGVGVIDTQKTYRNSELTAVVTKGDPSIVPFMTNGPEYCKVDTDCVAGPYFCAYGSYNKYRPYADVWGCGDNTLEESYPQESAEGLKELQSMCPNSYPIVKYGGSKCISNVCTPQNRQVTCSVVN